MRNRILLLLTLMVVTPSWATQTHKQVVLLLWRGVTDAERGFVDYLSERVNVEFTYLNADKDIQRLRHHIAHLETLRPDLVYTFGTTVTRELLGTSLQPTEFRSRHLAPVVFSVVSDPLGSGLISSDPDEARPFTGVSHIVPHKVQLNAISRLSHVKSLGVVFNPQENNSVITANKIHLLAHKFGLDVHLYPFALVQNKVDLNSLNSIIKTMQHDHVDLAYLPPDSYVISNGKPIVDALHHAGLLTFSATESPIRNHDALMGIVSRYYNVGQFAAHKAELILHGQQTAEQIPIEALSQYSYIVNIRAAKRLNYFPPVSILKISELIGTEQ
ncbi:MULTISPECIES: ABC transporter substrate-binding protein [unclassified Vibrio]|uniref:ABC transporter substrate-binding protein n=1 Tax=unclassified Vibrio TaxID=2614977 RepID=UPI001360C3E8|nr:MULTISPECIES: ABC transporter substrate-binding protein [unclassified Vibrio]NAW59581.1 ABC transporter substrate-binding protein [Vibrio sp. V36_P2S2PM302]NAX24279.1 ABC transporter substrate-binding protein [Vibrio sp. V38_P2S17PM301]NAX32137.1 ABC transporter substrate-binding protein [Vibrio sp. V37_P2S8PM304]